MKSAKLQALWASLRGDGAAAPVSREVKALVSALVLQRLCPFEENVFRHSVPGEAVEILQWATTDAADCSAAVKKTLALVACPKTLIATLESIRQMVNFSPFHLLFAISQLFLFTECRGPVVGRRN
jgi:hypothetical protein